MANRQKIIKIDKIEEEINIRNQLLRDDENQKVLQEFDNEHIKHFDLTVDRKDVGLNVLNHWNIGYNDTKSKKWISSIIELVNEAPNAMIIATNIFTFLNYNAPKFSLSYEAQIALAISILSQVKDKPVLLWPGKTERNIYNVTNTDIMKVLYSYLEKNGNVYLVEELENSKNHNEAIMFVDLHLKNDFIKNPIITLELRDYTTCARTVKSAQNRVKRVVNTKTSDFIIDLAVLQNAKIFPNLLCVGPACDEQYERNIKATELTLTSSYYKLEVKKNNSKNGLNNPKGYTPIALKCDYAFDRKQEMRKDKNNITANMCIEKLDDVEEGVLFEILNYYLSKKEDLDKTRREKVQNMLNYKKDKQYEIDMKSKKQKKSSKNKKTLQQNSSEKNLKSEKEQESQIVECVKE